MANGDGDLIAALVTRDIARLLNAQEIAEEQRRIAEAEANRRARRNEVFGQGTGDAFFAAFAIPFGCFVLMWFLSFATNFSFFWDFFVGIFAAILVGLIMGAGLFVIQTILVLGTKSDLSPPWWLWRPDAAQTTPFYLSPLGIASFSLAFAGVVWRLALGPIPLGEWPTIAFIATGLTAALVAGLAYRNGEGPFLAGGLGLAGLALVFVWAV